MAPSSAHGSTKTSATVRFSEGGSRGGKESAYLKQPNRRRIFVQTDTGNVLGIDLDQTDNAQTVKKKMQTLLNVPTEQTTLVFGETVLKSDLSYLRNESPVLLTRELHRSLSTPCMFNPLDIVVQRKRDRPLQIVGRLRCCPKMRKIIKDVLKALDSGVEPVAVGGGLGGAYYLRNCRGESVAVVKPTDEEPFAPNNPKGFVGKALGQPGLKRTVRVGETGIREVAAYLLDHENFARVPATVLVKISHRVFNVNIDNSVHKEPGKISAPVAKLASCQQFVPHDYDASDHGTSCFSVASVHRIGILDVRIFNTDRHAGNILVRNEKYENNEASRGCSILHVTDTLELIPIDHGLCLPEDFEDPYFEWLHWPQASVPFSEEELRYIEKLDTMKDVDMLRSELPMLREACCRMLTISTTLLKKAAAAGLCLREIGEMMSRDDMEETSLFEELCRQAKREAAGGTAGDGFSDASLEDEADEFLEQFEVDICDENGGAKGDESENISVPVLILPDKSFWKPSFQHNTYLTAMPEDQAHLEAVSEDAFLDEVEGSGFHAAPTNVERTSLSSNRRVSARVPVSSYSRNVSSPRWKGMSNMHYDNSRPPQKILNSTRFKQISCRDENVLQKVTTLNLKQAPLSKDRVKASNDFPNRNIIFDYSSKHSGRRKGFIGGVPLTPAPQQRTNSFTGDHKSLTLALMNNDEWTLFMDFFTKYLDEAISKKCNDILSLRQRLGASCRF